MSEHVVLRSGDRVVLRAVQPAAGTWTGVGPLLGLRVEVMSLLRS